MLYTLANSSWLDTFSPQAQKSAIDALEGGQVIYLPQLAFEFSAAEKELLTPRILGEGSKNISYNPTRKTLKGVINLEKDTHCLKKMMARYSSVSDNLLNALFSRYAGSLMKGRTSFRPIEIAGRATSLLKDDTRLHVDAFPATPNHGKRIIRVFTNVNPVGKGRIWHLGEPFEQVVEQFLPLLRKPLAGMRRLLFWCKVTKTYRTLYDHYMLMLHDEMKKDAFYQRRVKKTVVDFQPGTTWIVMTDSVSHAALSGQFVLEYTSYLPPHAMANVEQSPLFILEQALGQKLIDS